MDIIRIVHLQNRQFYKGRSTLRFLNTSNNKDYAHIKIMYPIEFGCEISENGCNSENFIVLPDLFHKVKVLLSGINS
jgi:hypothetical protein